MSGAVLDRVSRRGLAIAIVGALTGVLLTATPAAAATCGTFSGGTLTIAPSGSNETVTVARTAGGTITVNGAACTATVTSTNTIVFPNPGVNRSETFVIDTTNGPFAPGADEVGDPTAEIEWSLDFGGGNGDALQVLGGSGADVITLGTGGFNLSGDADADGAVPANNENYQLSGAGGSDTISAAGSAATGSGFNGAVTMNGGADNDTITGGPANDTINGDDGADVLDGGVGNAGNAYDALRGGTAAGSDTSTSDTVTYASVSEAVTVDLAFAGFQLTGGAYYDDIAAIENVVGTSATDTLTGNAGNNSITGAGANDTISGAAGNDTFPQGIAAEGADAISGGDGTDSVDYSQRTTAVNVTLTAAAANDGAAGENDDIGGALATQDVENVNGGSGDDVLVGDSVGTVTNTFNGNAGDDVIDGMGGADNESGDAGYDYFVQSGTTANGSDIMQGGADADIVDYSSRTGAITVSLDGTATANDGVGGAAEGDKVVAEDVIGGSAGDTITGDAERNILEGGGGVDTLLGAGDRDFLVGGPGGDTLNGGTGKDGVSYHTATSGLTIDLTPGPGSGEAFNDVYTNIDIVLGSNFDDVIRDNANDNMVSGGDGNDTITGNGGNDVLLGGAGSDILRGGADKDNLNAGEGADSDVLVGGAGTRDMINYSTCGAGVTIDLSLGGTTQGGGGDGAIGGAGDQNTGGCGTDDISDAEYIRGSYFDDVLTGDANSNNIFGAAGADSLVGRAANDNLYGGPGIDNVIDGGAGDDECIGGDGETAVGCEEVGVVDTTPPPVPTITSSPTNPSSSTDASFSFTDTEPGVSFECQLDGGAFTSCTSSHNYSGLGSGSHTFGVRARDAAGNTSAAATYTWTIELGDTTPPPVPTITSNPTNPSSSPNASFGFTDTEPGVTFECQLDGGAFATCTSTRDYSGLAAGSHTFGLRARDAAGNTSAAATYTWTINPCAEVSMVGGNNFSPNAVTISVGCSVRWTNTVNTTHTTTSDPAGTWDSGNMANGATFSRQFATAGTYNYRCTIHASMTGTITVQP